MRTLILFAVATCAYCTSVLPAENEFPYTGYISADHASVRSGPGEVHYVTENLRRGTTVEVYRHDPGGWCAVRPPRHSFSWVPARHLVVTDDSHVGRITTEEATAMVGSTSDSIEKYIWQVRLRKGEFVELLGEQKELIDSKRNGETWLKIAPPAGEFRWIRLEHISRTPLAPTVEQSPKATTVSFDQASDITEPSKISDTIQHTSSTVVTDSKSSEDFATQAQSVDIQLCRILSREPKLWQFEPLRTKATEILGRANSDLERGQARLLIDKIERFEQLKTRHVLNESQITPVSFETVNETPMTESTKTLESRESLRQPGLVDDIDPRFDGTGFLVPVHARTPEAPKYALIDRDGQVYHYLTPAPGFNLNRYLRLEIGVYGQRGYIRKLNVPHLTVHRVVVLERHRK